MHRHSFFSRSPFWSLQLEVFSFFNFLWPLVSPTLYFLARFINTSITNFWPCALWKAVREFSVSQSQSLLEVNPFLGSPECSHCTYKPDSQERITLPTGLLCEGSSWQHWIFSGMKHSVNLRKWKSIVSFVTLPCEQKLGCSVLQASRSIGISDSRSRLHHLKKGGGHSCSAKESNTVL